MSAETLRGRRGAVSAGSQLPATIAMQVLRDGGNAVDAAIAGAAAQCVCEMPWCGIGGDGFALLRLPDGTVHGFNGSGVAPANVLHALGERPQVPRFGAVSAAVPAVIDAWYQLHDRFGTMPFGDLLEPAIQLARDGVPLDPRLLGALLEIPDLEGGDQLTTLLDGAELALGRPFRQPDLAGTLAAIESDGPDAFYRGEVAASIARHVAARGGALDASDLAAHDGRWVDPVSVRYRDATVHSNAPVSMGVLLLVCLRVLEHRFPGGMPGDPLERTDVLVRVKQIVFGEVLPLLGDPAIVSGPDPLDDALISDIVRRLETSAPAPGGAFEPLGTDTTSLAVTDSDGLAVSFIHSLFNEFGARELVPGTGIVLNDRLANLRTGTGNNALEPGKRPLHTLHSYLAERADGPLHVGATPGGRGQVQTNLQVLLNLLDDGEPLQAAIDRPRWVSGLPRRAPDDQTLYLEPALADIADALSERGHVVEVVDSTMNDHFGNCSVVGHDADTGVHLAAADARRAGHAAVW